MNKAWYKVASPAVWRFSQLPILLRPKGEEYCFVRMTYVGGPVSGEIEAFWRRNDIQPGEVVLV